MCVCVCVWGVGGQLNFWYQMLQQGNLFAFSICPNSSFPACLEVPWSAVLHRPSCNSDLLCKAKCHSRRSTGSCHLGSSLATRLWWCTAHQHLFLFSEGWWWDRSGTRIRRLGKMMQYSGGGEAWGKEKASKSRAGHYTKRWTKQFHAVFFPSYPSYFPSGPSF